MKKTHLILVLIFITSSFISAQNTYTVGAEGGVKFQTGNLTDVWGEAWGFSVLGSYNLSNLLGSSTEIQLILKAGDYSARTVQKFNDAYGAIVKTPVSVEWPLRFMPITLGVKYFLFADDVIKPYVSAAVGTTLMKLLRVSLTAATGTVYNNGSDVIIGGFSYDFGTGVQFLLSKSIYLDVNAEYDGIAKDIKVPTYTSTSQFKLIGYNVGLGVRL